MISKGAHFDHVSNLLCVCFYYSRSDTFIEKNGIEIGENKQNSQDKYIFGCFTILGEVSFFIMVDLVFVGFHQV